VRFHFPLCDFILVTHTDSCKQAQRAAILLPISFSRSCAPVTFPDSRTSAQGEVFLPTEATAAVFDFCRRRQDLDFVSFCSVLASSAKLLRWYSAPDDLFFFHIVCCAMDIHLVLRISDLVSRLCHCGLLFGLVHMRSV
jgi:hypothetical protein